MGRKFTVTVKVEFCEDSNLEEIKEEFDEWGKFHPGFVSFEVVVENG